MGLKLFKTKQFNSLDDFLQWLDDVDDRVIVLNTVKTNVFVATYAEAPGAPARFNAASENKRGVWRLLNPAD